MVASLALSLLASGAAEKPRCLAMSGGLPATEIEPGIEEAVEAARARIAAAPDDDDAYGRLGTLLEAYARFEAAAACYGEALERAPNGFRWLYLLGSAQASAGMHDEAVGNLERASEIDPTYAPAGLRLAAALLSAGRAERSLEAAKRVVAANPSLPQAHYAVGQALAEAGRLRPALESFERACELLPQYGAAHYARAQTLRRLGEDAAARKAIDRHQQLRDLPPAALDDPLGPHNDALGSGARAHIARGAVAAGNQESDEAVREFEAALAINPRLVVAHSNLILLYGEIGRIEDARRHYEAALESNPGWAQAHYNWGALLAQQGRLEEADSALRQALESDSHYADARVQLGLTLDGRERFDEAEVQYRRALESNPLHEQAHYLLGGSLLRKGRIEEGLEELERAVGSDDAQRMAQLDALAAAHETEGNIRAARWYARRGRRLAEELGKSESIERFDERLRRLDGVE